MTMWYDHSVLVVTLIACNSIFVTCDSVTLDLHFYPSAQENSLVCNDGTPGGYYFRPASQDAEEESRDKWIFHLQGGGWCWDDTSCRQRISLNGG